MTDVPDGSFRYWRSDPTMDRGDLYATMVRPRHPAKYSTPLVPIIRQWLEGVAPLLDPMAGIGNIRLPGLIYSELEPEWAVQCPNPKLVADAAHLPFPDEVFAGAVTSPCYGNRMADHHDAQDGSRRTTYRHTLGRPLHSQNTGQLQWGATYKVAHWLIWKELHRVLRPNAIFVLNISDHIRKGKAEPVTQWHRETLEQIGFEVEVERHIETQRLRYGENDRLRVDYESLIKFRRLPA